MGPDNWTEVPFAKANKLDTGGKLELGCVAGTEDTSALLGNAAKYACDCGALPEAVTLSVDCCGCTPCKEALIVPEMTSPLEEAGA